MLTNWNKKKIQSRTFIWNMNRNLAKNKWLRKIFLQYYLYECSVKSSEMNLWADSYGIKFFKEAVSCFPSIRYASNAKSHWTWQMRIVMLINNHYRANLTNVIGVDSHDYLRRESYTTV